MENNQRDNGSPPKPTGFLKVAEDDEVSPESNSPGLSPQPIQSDPVPNQQMRGEQLTQPIPVLEQTENQQRSEETRAQPRAESNIPMRNRRQRFTVPRAKPYGRLSASNGLVSPSLCRKLFQILRDPQSAAHHRRIINLFRANPALLHSIVPYEGQESASDKNETPSATDPQSSA